MLPAPPSDGGGGVARTHRTSIDAWRSVRALLGREPFLTVARVMQTAAGMAKLRKRDDVRRHLHARRFELLSRYRDLIERAERAANGHEPDVLDRAEDEWDARVLSVMSDGDARSLDEVVEALHRLDRGDYGRCASCGLPIEPLRLRTLPEAALCVECAADAEELAPRWMFAAGGQR